MFELMDSHTSEPVIKVIGVGGGGGNAARYGGARYQRGIHLCQHRCAGTEENGCPQHHKLVRALPRVWAPVRIWWPPGGTGGRERIQESIDGSTCCLLLPAWVAEQAPVLRQ